MPKGSRKRDGCCSAESKPKELKEVGCLHQEKVKIPDLSKKMRSIVGVDGLPYQSRAEAIVANWLYLSGVQYEPHPPLGLRGKSRPREADFKLIETGEIVEVFMCSVDGLAKRGKDAPIWGYNYVIVRDEKIAYFKASNQKLIIIEAEIYRYKGLYRYLDHIQQVFVSCGIHLVDGVRKKLPIDGEARGINWTLEEFISYALKNKFTMLVDFQSPGHSDLYAVLNTRSELSNQLRRELDKLFNRKSVVRKEELLPLDELREIVMQMDIRERVDYEEAYRLHRLPSNAPNSIFEAYGISWNKFIYGKHIKDFLPFQAARKIVRKKRFQSRSQFFTAVRTDPDLLFVRKSPSSDQGGYAEFISWPDFLGTLSAKEQQKIKMAQNELSRLGNSLAKLDFRDAANCLQKFKLTNAKKIQDKSPALYQKLRDRSDWPKLLAQLSGRIVLVTEKKEAIKLLIAEKCFNRADFFQRRQSNTNLQRLPAHIERLGYGIFESVRACVDARSSNHQKVV